MNEVKVFICDECGQALIVLSEDLSPLSCCDKEMKEVSSGDNIYKHLHSLRYKIKGNKVIVDVSDCPPLKDKDHFIDWIGVRTNQGSMFKYLNKGTSPHAVFVLNKGERVLDITASCNIDYLLNEEDIMSDIEEDLRCGYTCGCKKHNKKEKGK